MKILAPEIYEKAKPLVAYAGQSISISGPSAVGKSTVSRLLADSLGYLHFDLDEEVCKKAGVQTSIEFFAQHGHAAFKQSQYECISEIVQSSKKYVLAAGGEIWRPGYDQNLITLNRELLAKNTYNICLLPSTDLDEIVDVLYPRLNDGKRDTRTKSSAEFAHYVELGIQQYLDLADACIFVHHANAESVLSLIQEKVVK